MLSRRVFLASAAAGILRAQEKTPAASATSATGFSTDVKVVSVLAAVRDKQGKIIANLHQDDFELTEDGHPQTIRYFSRETELPLTLGLLVDTSFSQRQVLGEEKTASRRFIEKVLREDRDQTFLIHFDRQVELLQDLTESRARLEHALDELELPRDGRPQLNRRGSGYPGGGYPGGGGRGGAGRSGGNRRAGAVFGTALYDSILLASDELMKKRQGRKALVLLTDGVDSRSKVPLSEAIESAQRADTLVYSILFAGNQERSAAGFGGGRRGRRFPQAQHERPDGRKVLQQISTETGGAFLEVSKKLPIDGIYERIEEELRNQYSLGYTSDQSSSTGGFRRISVTVKPKGLLVQARAGYYPGQ
jgi:VWFA-related protein